MTSLAEGDLQIALPAGAAGRKFDDGATHGLSHCMKAVDFIVELDERILFIEFKDPDHPAAQPRDRNTFLTKILSGGLDSDLKTKYRDSFLYEWASGRVTKPIYYLVLIGASSLSEAELLARTDALRRQLPALGPGDKPWKKPFVAGCGVMNIETWNEKLPQFPVSRLSA
jgi:hypothetical protein